MKTLFDIRTDKQANKPYTLLLEVGPEHCCYAYFDKSSQGIHRINYSVFSEFETERHVGNILNDIKNEEFESVLVSSTFPQAIIMPRKLFKDDYSLLDTIYDLPVQTHLHDVISEWQMVVMYSVPERLHELVSSEFGDAKLMHAYTPSIKLYNGFIAENQVCLHFTSNHFSVLVKKGQQIHLVQTYSYKTPLDVIYYLLKISYEFELQQEAHLILSGLIEKDSAMFRKLNEYFFQLHFAQPPSFKLPESNHPQYFFSSLYNLAACAL